ncbi:hypothetical protein TCDM_02669 [Trypanosoma cruzi Dm28c]|uniref:Uncharacterized protein n=1 Tax=Trypanosoma cruzi Dm28c TaxID=1416333 RepID=V5BVI0_TRYCR|nr:hypothetical protein TCDM_02669 [Trypanosoma cruzi Dm28c]
MRAAAHPVQLGICGFLRPVNECEENSHVLICFFFFLSFSPFFFILFYHSLCVDVTVEGFFFFCAFFFLGFFICYFICCGSLFLCFITSVYQWRGRGGGRRRRGSGGLWAVAVAKREER